MEMICWHRIGSFRVSCPRIRTWAVPGVVRLGTRLTRLALALGISTVLVAAETEPLGPCTRRTPLVISEIMYHPPARPDGKDLEFVEIYNSQPWFYELSGFRLAGDIAYSFAPGTRLASNAFLVVARSPADVASVYGLTNVVGGYSGQLGRPSGSVRLEHRNGGVLVKVDYAASAPWPVAPDGTGHSLVLARASLGAKNAQAWAASAEVGGSPGGLESVASDPRRSVVINEVVARPTAEGEPFVELYNHSAESVNVSGCWLSNDPNTGEGRIPEGTTITPGGFLVLHRSELGFELKAAGDTVYFWNPDRTVVLDAFRFGPQGTGIPHGRFPNGAATLRLLAKPTPGASNDRFFLPDVAINEIMYAPISRDPRDEYVELYNSGTETIDLGGWRFVDGIDFTFPSGTRLTAGGYLVVAKDAAWLRAKYDDLTSANTWGNYQGSLANGGEHIALARPEAIRTADGLGGITDVLAYVTVDEANYGDGGHWGEWANGGGSSLELVHPRSDHLEPSSWADSDETAKAEWTWLEATGPLDAPPDNGESVRLPLAPQVMLLGAGECLLDEVVCKPLGRANVVANPSFDAGMTGWVGEGTHQDTSLSSGGSQGSSCLRLRASGRGDSLANRLLGTFTEPVATKTVFTLGARVRWLRGSPELLLRVTRHYLEAYGELPVPANLGTPGMRNSRAVDNGGPAIGAVAHYPVVPRTNQTVVISAPVHDLDGLAEVRLRYRVDPSTELQSAPMTDDGLGGDAVGGDGVYSATLPGQTNGTVVAFHIEARDLLGATSKEPPGAPARECLVRFGDPDSATQFGVYRLWMTAATVSEWRKRSPVSNHPLQVTFVYGNHRAVHQVGAMFAGGTFNPSPDSPVGGTFDYALVFPSDDLMLGETDMVLCWPGLTRSLDSTAQSEQIAFWIAEQLGLASNYRRYAIVFVQGVKRNAIMEDAQQPNRAWVEQWIPHDTDGDLYKLQAWSESSQASRQYSYYGFASLEDSPVLDSRQKVSRYRWSWQKRAANGRMHDFRSLFELVQAMNLSPAEGYTQAVENLVDVDQWMRVMAVERAVGNWDSFGYQLNKNMYAYRPQRGRWQLALWDIDVTMGGSLSAYPTDSIFTHTSQSAPAWSPDSQTQRFFAHPPFRRAYLRALKEAAGGPMVNAAEVLDAKWAAFRTNQIGLSAPTAVKSYLKARRDSILKQLTPFNVPFQVSTEAGGGLTATGATVTLTGTAPFAVQTIAINSQPYPVTWTTVTKWSLTLPVTAAQMALELVGQDPYGQPVPDATTIVTVAYPGPGSLLPVPVWINEWMASNTRAVADPADNDFEDWFELYNPNPFPVSLAGYRLTDRLDVPTKFVIPAGIVLPPQGQLLVWADEEPEQTNLKGDLHVNFKLSRSGETVALSDPAGRLVDWVTFGVQADDVSEGRWPDGGPAPFRRMPSPTPRAANLVPEAAPPLQILSILDPANGTLALIWNADLGEAYRVETVDKLASPVWLSGGVITAWGPTAGLTVLKGAASERYYRIKRVSSGQ